MVLIGTGAVWLLRRPRRPAQTESGAVLGIGLVELGVRRRAAPLARWSGPHVKEADHDGLDDLLAHFLTDEAGIAFGDFDACVTGELRDGTTSTFGTLRGSETHAECPVYPRESDGIGSGQNLELRARPSSMRRVPRSAAGFSPPRLDDVPPCIEVSIGKRKVAE